MTEENLSRFADLDYEGFRKLAADPSLSMYEKIGFPNAYREGFEEAIFEDILTKLSQIKSEKKVIVDIGAGCSELPQRMIRYCKQQNHELILIDSSEMLSNLPDDDFIKKVEGFYPNEASAFLEEYRGKVDAILVYSVIQYVFAEANIFEFFDESLSLLNHGGQLLIGDLPNISKRKRFFSSETGIAYHKAFMKTEDAPEVDYYDIAHKTLDDAVIFALMMRARQAGFDSYLMPQSANLPMANRREDLLIQRP